MMTVTGSVVRNTFYLLLYSGIILNTSILVSVECESHIGLGPTYKSFSQLNEGGQNTNATE